MEFNETIESSNIEESYDDIYKDLSVNNENEFFIEEDIFADENIEATLKRYNYDYKTLMRELTTFIDYSKLLEILNEFNIKKEEYLNPTYVTFEKIREKIINNKDKS